LHNYNLIRALNVGQRDDQVIKIETVTRGNAKLSPATPKRKINAMTVTFKRIHKKQPDL